MDENKHGLIEWTRRKEDGGKDPRGDPGGSQWGLSGRGRGDRGRCTEGVSCSTSTRVREALHVRSERRRGQVSCARWQLGSPPSASSRSTPPERLPETLPSQTTRGCEGVTASQALRIRGATREACMCERTARAGHINTTRGRASREPWACVTCIWICRLLCPRSVFRVLFFGAPPPAAGPPPSVAAAGMSSATYSASRSWQDLPPLRYLLQKLSLSHASLSLSVPPAVCAGQSGPGAALRGGPASVGVETRQALFRLGTRVGLRTLALSLLRATANTEAQTAARGRAIMHTQTWAVIDPLCPRSGRRATGAHATQASGSARVGGGENAGGGSRRSGPLQHGRWVATADADIEQRRRVSRAEHHIDTHIVVRHLN